MDFAPTIIYPEIKVVKVFFQLSHVFFVQKLEYVSITILWLKGQLVLNVVIVTENYVQNQQSLISSIAIIVFDWTQFFSELL